ncbi:hypothetical protein D6783_04125 [Candidatus Woesearchaeota archaeon]|nr:MAG: hypothetical protein D6783_04125 [Candidatus Woesearchaeota archaeon]
MKYVLDVDPVTGLYTTLKKDGDVWVAETKQDVEELLDENQRELTSKESGWKGDWHKVASIPLNIWNQWSLELKRQGRHPLPSHPSNRDWFVAKLNSKDWFKLRTKEGRI